MASLSKTNNLPDFQANDLFHKLKLKLMLSIQIYEKYLLYKASLLKE